MALDRDKTLQAFGVKMDQMRSELLQTSQNLILENFSKLPNAQPTMNRTLLQDFEQHTKTFVDQQISNLSQMVQTLDAKNNGIDLEFLRTSEMEKAIQMIFRKCDSVCKANPINPPLSSDPIFIAMQSEVARVGLELVERDRKIVELESAVRLLVNKMGVFDLPPQTAHAQPPPAASLQTGANGGGAKF